MNLSKSEPEKIAREEKTKTLNALVPPKKGTKINKPSSPLKPSVSVPSTSTAPQQTSASMDTSNVEETLPAPIYVKAMKDCIAKCRELESLIGPKSFTCRSTTNSTTFKFKTSDGYRKAVRYFRGKNIDFHTYQQQEEKSFQVEDMATVSGKTSTPGLPKRTVCTAVPTN
jgi:hypothetical protein